MGSASQLRLELHNIAFFFRYDLVDFLHEFIGLALDDIEIALDVVFRGSVERLDQLIGISTMAPHRDLGFFSFSPYLFAEIFPPLLCERWYGESDELPVVGWIQS